MAGVLGRYELLRPIARGGMAEVFLARRRSAGGVYKRLVVKRIRRERATDPRFVDLFVREARVSMALSHRNIVPVFDFGRAGDELFLVMEYVDGPDLASALSRQREVEPMIAAYIAMEACDALGHAHKTQSEAGSVVHRDVTPRNILLSFAGEVKLVDFGVAAALADASTQGRVRGTPAYMAPEQAAGDNVDGRADLFSLGLVLWEMLAGRRAYDSEGRDEQLEQAKAGEVPELPGSVAEPLREIVQRLTRRELGDRFETAADVHAALDEFIVSERAKATKRRAPSRRLSEWLGELYPDKRIEGPDGDVSFPSGSVMTFLDHGEQGVRDGEDAATLRSIAETVAEAEPEPEPELNRVDTAGDSVDETATVPRPSGPPWLWIGVGLVAIAAAAFAVMSGGGKEPEPRRVAAVELDAAVAAASSEADAGWDTTSGATTLDPSTETRDRSTEHPDPSTEHRDPSTEHRDPSTEHRDPRDAGRRKPEPVRRAPDAGVATGKVRVGSRPWAQVTVKGQSARCAETPCTLELPAGRHTLQLHNPVAELTKTVEVTIEAGKTATVTTDLR